MRTYEYAKDAEKLAKGTAIPSWHPHLAMLKICYLEDQEDMVAKGRTVLAKIRKVNAVEAYITGHDLILIISGPSWRTLGAVQRIALIDHELCHVIEADSGDGYTMVSHDLEEFNAVVKRHGAWWPDIAEFVSAVQGDLFEEPEAEAETAADSELQLV